MFDHLGIVIKDANKSLPFYEACLAPLGIRKTQDLAQWRAAIFMIPGTRQFLWIGAGAADQPQQRLTGYFHLAFSAPDEASLLRRRTFGGGAYNGQPGLRRPRLLRRVRP